MDKEWERGVQRLFGSSVEDFAAKGIVLRRGPVPHCAIQVGLVNGTWFYSMLNLAELEEFLQTTPEKEWKKT